MGQDLSCGICGKHYQSCPHTMKEHISRDEKRTVCGNLKKNLVVLPDDWIHRDIDLDDICKTCLNHKSTKALLAANPSSTMAENMGYFSED